MAERPLLRATVAPLRTRRWTPEAQRHILQHELCDLALYRHLTSEDDEVAALLGLLEGEFDALIDRRPQSAAAAVADEDDEDPVCCLRFPPMRPKHRYLIAAAAARYHLQTSSFDEEDARFAVVYKHARDAMRPVLRLSDLRAAASYYTPPPPPPP
eukprot:464865-Prymnesium_polylepis.1